MSKTYQIVTKAAKESAAIIEQFCQTNGQILLPLVNLIQSAGQVVETVIHEIGIQTLELILKLSAEQVAGARTPGKASGDIRWYGSQPGKIKLADRKVKVKRPRLRHKTDGEVEVPAYEALQQDRGLSERMLGALLRGVSTREYAEVLPAMAETVGVSRSAISRQVIEASAEQLKQLQERRWDQIDILVIYIDGQRFGAHHILSAVGVSVDGKKHILGSSQELPRTLPPSNGCSPICGIKACPPIVNTCLSSMGPRRCARESKKYSALSSRCSAAAITRFAMFSTSCRRTNKAKR